MTSLLCWGLTVLWSSLIHFCIRPGSVPQAVSYQMFTYYLHRPTGELTASLIVWVIFRYSSLINNFCKNRVEIENFFQWTLEHKRRHCELTINITDNWILRVAWGRDVIWKKRQVKLGFCVMIITACLLLPAVHVLAAYQAHSLCFCQAPNPANQPAITH